MLEAATEGARLRFRPVMMTSFAFILGLLPLVVAEGPSRLARRNVGTPVFGGMIWASFIGIFAIPALYVIFQSVRERLRSSARPVEITARDTYQSGSSRLTQCNILMMLVLKFHSSALACVRHGPPRLRGSCLRSC